MMYTNYPDTQVSGTPSSTLYDLSFHTPRTNFPCILTTWPHSLYRWESCAGGEWHHLYWGNRGPCSRRNLKILQDRYTWRYGHYDQWCAKVNDVMCCLSQVTMATITMATGWLLLLVVMMSMMTTVSGGKLQDVSQNENAAWHTILFVSSSSSLHHHLEHFKCAYYKLVGWHVCPLGVHSMQQVQHEKRCARQTFNWLNNIICRWYLEHRTKCHNETVNE